MLSLPSDTTMSRTCGAIFVVSTGLIINTQGMLGNTGMHSRRDKKLSSRPLRHSRPLPSPTQSQLASPLVYVDENSLCSNKNTFTKTPALVNVCCTQYLSQITNLFCSPAPNPVGACPGQPPRRTAQLADELVYRQSCILHRRG
jgi:hypothetical protein